MSSLGVVFAAGLAALLAAGLVDLIAGARLDRIRSIPYLIGAAAAVCLAVAGAGAVAGIPCSCRLAAGSAPARRI